MNVLPLSSIPDTLKDTNLGRNISFSSLIFQRGLQNQNCFEFGTCLRKRVLGFGTNTLCYGANGLHIKAGVKDWKITSKNIARMIYFVLQLSSYHSFEFRR